MATLFRFQPPQWMVDSPIIPGHCFFCRGALRGSKENIFCLTCHIRGVEDQLLEYQHLTAHTFRQFAIWYMESFWVRCGRLRDIKLFHKIFNLCYKARAREYVAQVVAFDAAKRGEHHDLLRCA